MVITMRDVPHTSGGEWGGGRSGRGLNGAWGWVEGVGYLGLGKRGGCKGFVREGKGLFLMGWGKGGGLNELGK